MAASSLVLCNNALTLLGTRRITALADPSKEARACNDNYDACRRAVLRMHPWNFALKRVALAGAAITNCANNGAGLVQVTSPAHGLVTGNYCTIDSVVGTVEANVTNNTVTVIDANNFTLDGSVFATSYVSGGTAAPAPGFEYRYKFALPADYIRLASLKDNTDEPLSNQEWKVEGAAVLTSYNSVHMRYVYDLQTTTAFDPLFDEALAAYLANQISLKITGSESQKQALQQMLGKSLELARFVDSVEDPAEIYDCDDWTRARFGVNEGFVRSPMTN